MGIADLSAVLRAARLLHDRLPEVAAFAPWPVDMVPGNLAPLDIPAARQVAGFAHRGNRDTQPLIDAITASTAHGHWTRTYSEAEVGAHFLETYGYYELFGPNGHFRSPDLRAYVAYWGPGLDYAWHSHAAEEMYVVLAGQARFRSRRQGDAVLGAGQTRVHAGHESHAMVTDGQPVLTYVLWRGAGLSDLPAMDSA